MVGNAVVKTNEEAKKFDFTAIQSDDYNRLANVKSGRFLLSTHGLNSLYNLSTFKEIRLSCFKTYHSRRVNIITVGDSVVQWLLQRSSLTPKPHSCSSFIQLPNDNSFIADDCRRWSNGTWNNNVLYYFPIAAQHGRGRSYFFSLDYNFYTNHLFCDDWSNHPYFSNAGEWTFYVR